MTLARVQAVSGLVFGLFLCMHLATTICAVGGSASYDAALGALRGVYRPHIVVELLLIGVSGAVHIGCAAVKIRRRRRATGQSKPSLVIRVHRWAGYFLLLAIAGHVVATRVMPGQATAPTATGQADFSYLAYTVLHWPYFFDPYYLMLGAAGAVHLCLGTWRASSQLFGGKLNPQRARTIAAVAAVLLATCVVAGAFAIILGANGANRSRFEEYRELYERFMPFMP